MRRCSRCGQSKPDIDFMWRRKALQQRDSYCRPCRAAYKKEHYAANKQRYIANAAIHNRRAAIRRTEWLLEYFGANPCVVCGETDPLVLEFDHVGDKKFTIAEHFLRASWAAIAAEIEKCEVVCANCHRRRTAVRGGFLRAGVAQW